MGPVVRRGNRRRRPPRHHEPIGDLIGIIHQGIEDALASRLAPFHQASIVQQDTDPTKVQVARAGEGLVSDGIGIVVIRAYGSTTVGSQTGPQVGDNAVTHASSADNHRIVGYTAGTRSPVLTTAVSIAFPSTSRMVIVTAASKTITLPDASTVDPADAYIVKNSSTATGTTVASAGGTIDGSTTYSLVAAKASAVFRGDGTNWQLTGSA